MDVLDEWRIGARICGCVAEPCNEAIGTGKTVDARNGARCTEALRATLAERSRVRGTRGSVRMVAA